MSEGKQFQQIQQQNEILIGMPKSGNPWKKLSTKSSSRNKKFHKVSWEEKQKQRQQKKELQEYLKEYKAEKEKKIQEEKLRKKNKKKQDELNKYKTADLQIIKESKNIKKWTKKARNTLVKLPAEIFEQLLERQRRK
ncbi:unnamed protein product [Paramecium sonneborni]|uniref:Coiled-coil domain-containing protein 86 n=1 Tax=Paramecium sonneborni TaxID=65129 RepID=A0A8S1KDS7_9CILI|nr:unnamed protein product [Paramecium sonneborni]